MGNNFENISWREVLCSPLSRGEISLLLFMVLILPGDYDFGQSELGRVLGVETRHINQSLRKLAERNLIKKKKLRGSNIKRVTLNPSLKKKCSVFQLLGKEKQ